VTTGDWEAFVAEELVAYIDANYRTVPERESRGLAGHSMGGYGTIRIGMKRPDVFAAVYVMSACCMPAELDPEPSRYRSAASIETMEELQAAGFLTKAAFASAAAWSANPHNPPFYLDLPVQDGVVQPDVVARQAANAIFATIHQYIPELRSLEAIALDCGAQDGLADDTRELSRILEWYDIDHTSDIYAPGDHVSHVDGQVERRVLPFFAQQLRFP
jgi:S-formylglutathione hydrolase FrmB